MNLTDIQDALDESYQQELRSFTEETIRAFADAFAGKPTMVEWLREGFSGPSGIARQATHEAIYEELDYAEPRAAFMRVLAESNCPLVAELRKAITNSYIERNGPEVAEWRAA